MASAVLTRSSPIKRSYFRRKPTRVKEGADRAYKAWLRTLPCTVCLREAPSEVSHERRKGTGIGLKAPDRRAWPSCRRCHWDYEMHRGFFASQTAEARADWTDETCDLLVEAYGRLFGEDAELRECAHED